MRFAFLTASMLAIAAAISPAGAATLQGSALLNQGLGYKAASGPVGVKPGDLVMVNAGQTAQIVYSLNCVVVVEAGTVYTVQPDGYCPVVASTFDPLPYAVGAAVIGGGIAAGVLLSGSKPASP